MGNKTFTMIKPDAFGKGHSGAIIDIILKDGFQIKAMKLTKLSAEKAGEFYAIHKARPFFGELVDFMSSGPIVAAVLEKDNAVSDFRKLIGATSLQKLMKALSENCLLHQLGKMRFMAATVMKMQKLKAVSFSASLKIYKGCFREFTNYLHHSQFTAN